jgi:hypothetical protein
MELGNASAGCLRFARIRRSADDCTVTGKIGTEP